MAKSEKSTHELSILDSARACLDLLTKRDQKKLLFGIIAQVFAGLLDLLGVVLFGLIGILGTGSQSGNRVFEFLEKALIQIGFDFESEIFTIQLIAIFAATVLMAKSIFSVLIMRRVFRFLGNRQTQLAESMTNKLLSLRLVDLQDFTTQEYSYVLTQGIFAATTLTLGSLALIVGEASLLLFIGIALIAINPLVTVVSAIFFGFVGYFLQRKLSTWSTAIGNEISDQTIQGTESLQGVLSGYREILVLGRRNIFAMQLNQIWKKGGNARSDQIFIESLPKIAYEVALVIGGIFLAIWQFAFYPPAQAISTIIMFVVAGTRVLPSLLRLNSLALHVKTGFAQASLVFSVKKSIEEKFETYFPEVSLSSLVNNKTFEVDGKKPHVVLKDISVRYPGSKIYALRNISLEFNHGQKIAIVGSSGAGKSTLADVILGVIKPNSGKVLINGKTPLEIIGEYPGSIAYVPQSVTVFNTTIRNNIALGIPEFAQDLSLLEHAIKKAKLNDLIAQLPNGIDSFVGENGAKLSGGQRQRIGLARAFYSEADLYIFDEATSALDAETEKLVSDAMQSLDENVITITIAHRLATIVNSDLVIFLENGEISASGNFQDVCKISPAFRRQAEILGLQTQFD